MLTVGFGIGVGNFRTRAVTVRRSASLLTMNEGENLVALPCWRARVRVECLPHRRIVVAMPKSIRSAKTQR
jgi:hypothetical protein